MFARRHTRISAAAAILAVTAASAAIADAAGVINLPAIWQQEPNVPSPEGTAATVPADLAAAYAILRAPRQAADALPAAGQAAMTTDGGGGGHYGVNTALSRFAGSIGGVSFWLVPGNLGSCVYTSSDGSFCTSNTRVATEGIQGLLVPDAGGAVTFIGIVPDAATVTAANDDGSAAPVTRSGSAYVVTGDPLLGWVTVHEAGGAEDTSDAPTGSPPGAPPAASFTGQPPSSSDSAALR